MSTANLHSSTRISLGLPIQGFFTAMAIAGGAPSAAHADCGPIKECVEQLAQKIGGYQSQLNQMQILLDEAVIAFDKPSCPPPLQAYQRGAGKVIIGAGDGSLPDGPDDGNARDALTPRAFGAEGGVEMVRIGIGNMPPHDHLMGRTVDGTYMEGITNGQDVPNRNGGASDNQWKQGDGKPFDIMPPFVVLTLCEFPKGWGGRP